jgi:hypothetical protein
MKCRLLKNIIIDGRFIAAGNIVDDELLTEDLKTEAVITRDLDDRTKAMVLKEMHFTNKYVDHEGFTVTQPRMLGAGELIDANQIQPEWKEGTDFKYGWTPQERRAIQDRSEAEYLKRFQPKSEEPYENVIGYHSVRSKRS